MEKHSYHVPAISEVIGSKLCTQNSILCYLSLTSHLYLNHEGRWGTTDDFATSFLHFFPVLNCPLGLGKLQACPFPDVVFPPFPLSAFVFFPLSLCLAKWFWPNLMNVRHDHTTAIWSGGLYNDQEVFVWSDCLLDLGTDFIIGNIVFVWDA